MTVTNCLSHNLSLLVKIPQNIRKTSSRGTAQQLHFPLGLRTMGCRNINLLGPGERARNTNENKFNEAAAKELRIFFTIGILVCFERDHLTGTTHA